MSRATAAVGLVMILASCGGAGLTVSEYAAEAEELVGVMEVRFASLDAEWESQAPTLEGALSYWETRLQIREEFLEGVLALHPPSERWRGSTRSRWTSSAESLRPTGRWRPEWPRSNR